MVVYHTALLLHPFLYRQPRRTTHRTVPQRRVPANRQPPCNTIAKNDPVTLWADIPLGEHRIAIISLIIAGVHVTSRQLFLFCLHCYQDLHR